MTNKRILVGSVIGVAVAALLAAVGLVMTSNADFSEDYVTRQMAAQNIRFKPVEQLTDAEKQSACVVANAASALRTGAQAECFANEYIAVHLDRIGKGRTYAELGVEEFALQAQVADARERGSSRLPALEEDLATLRQTRELLFKGETLRGLLLTSFGFSTLGDKAGQAAVVANAAAAAVAFLSLLGLMAGLAGARGRFFATVRRAEAA